MKSRLLISASLALLVAATFGSPAAIAAEPQTSLKDLEDEVMCVICGVPLEKSLDAPAAQRERAFIEKMIAEGATKQEIKDALVAEYGEAVLAVPPRKGFGLTAWIVPIVGFLVAAVAVAWAIRRWRRETAADPEVDGEVESPAPLTAAENRRLDAELGEDAGDGPHGRP